MTSVSDHRPGLKSRMVKGVLIIGVLFLTAPTRRLDARVEGPGPRPLIPAQTTNQKDDAGARAAFLAAYQVFMHPRCMNCHPAGDIPLQGDDSHLHAQNVKRGPDGHGKYGMKCNACHQTTNLPGLNMPPGVATWHLPPPQMRMVFQGRTAGQLCRQLKNPRQNGGKNVAGLLEHVTADSLVLWGWAPGEGRTTPPLSHAEFVQRMREWVDKGGACPE